MKCNDFSIGILSAILFCGKFSIFLLFASKVPLILTLKTTNVQIYKTTYFTPLPEAGVLDEPYSAKSAQRSSHTDYRPARLHRIDTVTAYAD